MDLWVESNCSGTVVGVFLERKTMRKGNLKSPLQPSEVGLVMKMIRELIPTDVPLVCGHGHSIVKHTPHFRLKGITKDIPWIVDIYRGHFYHVQIDGWSEQFRSIPTLVCFLRQRLDIV